MIINPFSATWRQEVKQSLEAIFSVFNTSNNSLSGISSINGGPLGGFRNKIINGNFDFWQEGTSHSTDGYGSADQWFISINGSTATFSRQTFTLGQTDVPGNPTYYARFAVSSSAGAGNYALFAQRIEDVRTLAGGTATVTLYLKALSGTPNVAVEILQGFGTGGSPSSQNTVHVETLALTTSVQKFSFAVDIDSISGKAIGTNENSFLQIAVWADAGSDFNSRTNSLGQQSVTIDCSEVSVVQGDATKEAYPFSPRHPQQELALCQRYFAKTFPVNVAPVQNVGDSSGAVVGTGSVTNQSFSAHWTLPVTMRTSPTVTTYSPDSASANWNDQSGARPTASVINSSDKIIGLRGTTAVAAGGHYTIHATASARL